MGDPGFHKIISIVYYIYSILYVYTVLREYLLAIMGLS